MPLISLPCHGILTVYIICTCICTGVCVCLRMMYVCIVVSLHANNTSTSLLSMHECECVHSGYVLLFAASRLIHSNGPKWYTFDGSIHMYLHTLLTIDM